MVMKKNQPELGFAEPAPKKSSPLSDKTLKRGKYHFQLMRGVANGDINIEPALEAMGKTIIEKGTR